ncbi:hypothetical protein KBI51_02520 [Aerococcaceae bacterium zg-ZUI334]|uniref:hypothetical protein n=1 Tax=Aerococcaceae bacterium zg-252 TaxID=2796928 RepID=UPI001B8E8D18|nr:hypothetical protein [Aerococcaceae bacterium zg-ZUI334]
MKAKDFFIEIQQLENQIESKRYMAQNYRTLAEGLQSPSYSDMPKNPNRPLQPMADALGKAMEIERDISVLEQSLVEKKTIAMNIIYELLHNEYQVVLIKRHFEKKSWCQIMSTMYYSKSGIYKLYNQALEAFTRCLNREVDFSRPE